MSTNEEKTENPTIQPNITTQNPTKKKLPPFVKSLKKLQFLANLKLTKKYNCTKKSYEKCIIGNLLNNANCHLVAIFKEKMLSDYIDEFLRREYFLAESRERIPKFSVYYKNYLLFFCKPTFNNFCINEIINDYGEKKAEIYYKNNYQGGKSQNEEDNGFEESDSEDDSDRESQYDPKKNAELFDNSIKQSIDNVTIMTTINNSKNSTINLNLDNEKVEVFSENKCEVSNDTTVQDLMDIVKNGKNIIINQNKNDKNLNLKENKENLKDDNRENIKVNNKDEIKDNKENNQDTMSNLDGIKNNEGNKSKKSSSKGANKKKINNARNIIEFKKAMLSKGIHAYKNSNKSLKKYFDKNSNNMDMNKKILESNKLTIDKLNKLLKKSNINFNNNYNKSRNKYYYKNLNFYGNGLFSTGIISTDSNNFINTSNNINNKFNIYSQKNLKYTHTQDGLVNKKSKKKIYNNFSANLKNSSLSKDKDHERNISSHTNLVNNSNNYNNQCSIKNSFGNISGNNTNHNKNSRSRNNKGFLYKQNTAGGVSHFNTKGYGPNIYNTTSLHKICNNNNIINMKYPLNNIAYFGNYVFKTLNFMQNIANTHKNHQRNNNNLIKVSEDNNKIFGKYSNVSQDNHRSSLKILTADLGHLKYAKPVIKPQNEKIIKVNKKSPEMISNNNDNHVILGGWHKITKSSNNIKNPIIINSYNNIKKKKNSKNSKFRHQHYSKIVNNINTNDSSNKNHFTESHGDLIKSPLSLLLEGNSTFSNNNNKKNASNSKNQKRAKSNKCGGNNSHHKNKRRHNTNYNININNQININTNSNSGYNSGSKNLKDYLNTKIKHQEMGVCNLRQGINCINVGGGFYISGCNANYNLNLHNLNNLNKKKNLREETSAQN